ncbi:hypothetical protein QCA50_013549 [Cerrena zonata]|uniref:TRIP4/RQT4 C2HC5-type zinc finger domain-containing protein n=1 Tax=Cerrena zonata TaxID=2478898 RepID=A0AAW0FT56_9APHY
MHRTAWTTHSSSLPSDRIPPANRSSAAPKAKAKGKQNDTTAPPKSVEVRKLEKLRKDLDKSGGQDPKGGCFCQARDHVLSEYIPICRSCGLILCSLNAPCYACPHCATPILTPEGRLALISRIDNEISDTLLREEQQRQRAAEEVRQAEGAFPTLFTSSSKPSESAPGTLQSHPVNQSHKVLSLNSKTKKVKVSSFTTHPPSSASISKDPEKGMPADLIQRVPPPPIDVSFSTRQNDTDRPWARLDGENAVYVPSTQANNNSIRSKDRKKEESGKENNKGSK